jgi:hypothetical protein
MMKGIGGRSPSKIERKGDEVVSLDRQHGQEEKKEVEW